MATLEKLGLMAIDLVVVNPQPIRSDEQRRDEQAAGPFERIDIGGVAILRAAAKNHADIVVVADPADYPAVTRLLAGGGPTAAERRALAAKVFALTASYDQATADYLMSFSNVMEERENG
jgi:phosphoribosylaminoimidazolecarboxamide formyltransferase/IMP cyclohydrolase